MPRCTGRSSCPSLALGAVGVSASLRFWGAGDVPRAHRPPGLTVRGATCRLSVARFSCGFCVLSEATSVASCGRRAGRAGASCARGPGGGRLRLPEVPAEHTPAPPGRGAVVSLQRLQTLLTGGSERLHVSCALLRRGFHSLCINIRSIQNLATKCEVDNSQTG